MQSCIKIIMKNKKKYPEFIYYIPIIKDAKENMYKHPDRCIEKCKALLEGVSKTIILRLNSESTLKDLDKTQNYSNLVREAGKLLKNSVESDPYHAVEDGFINACCTLAQNIGELRNKRSDISHGRSVPKKSISTNALSKLTMQITDAILFYMLESFFIIANSINEKTVAQSEDTVLYNQYDDFNDYLDEDNEPFEFGNLRVNYSKILYDNHYQDYCNDLEEYKEREMDI